ncbi:hypothetical protein Poly59_61620 [Rubripirellula reticaptiva]|uniref:Uncharacterized protein n=1 Tax=Rubripirellula reticaptiva TaxID=2528013 RepID=A0A5C6E450_9BACT|nr:hypothetical protein Poly59_61620 [Rubripirellula reticaptiva]
MTCTGARLAAFLAMDSQLSVPRDVQRYPTYSLRCPAYFFAQAITSTFDCELVVRLLR